MQPSPGKPAAKGQVERVSFSGLFAVPGEILLATDLLDAGRSLPHAIAQAKACKATLHLLHVVAPGSVLVPQAGVVPYVDPESMAHDAWRVIGELAAQARKEGVPCVPAVRFGDPAEEVVRSAQEAGVGRVILATHGRHGMKRLLLGSVAGEILRKSPIPVCVIGPECAPPAEAQVKHILHPTALGPKSPASLRMAIELAKYHGARLSLLHVLPPQTGVDLDPQYLFKKMNDLVASVWSDASLEIEYISAAGDVSDEIVRAAKDIGAETIVMGLHPGHGALAVLAASPSPVLLVPEPLSVQLAPPGGESPQ